MFTEIIILNSFSLHTSLENVIYCTRNCGKSYKNISSLNKHLKYECNKMPQFKCLFCNKKAKRPDNLKKHMKLIHGYILKDRTNVSINDSPQNIINSKEEHPMQNV